MIMPEPILNNDEQKQLEWSKNWHTQRVNYMPWTDEQKAAYLRAIDSTYDEGGFTRDPYKVMGFTPKGNNININYKNAGNTEYGDQAETSGLVHELAHKLSYNANSGTGSIDSIAKPAGSSVTLSDGTGLTAPEGKVFGGWATSSSSTTAVTSPYTILEDTTLYAIWNNQT